MFVWCLWGDGRGGKGGCPGGWVVLGWGFFEGAGREEREVTVADNQKSNYLLSNSLLEL